MRWLLVPLLLLALLAPRHLCPAHLIVGDPLGHFALPPLPFGSLFAPLGSDGEGRDMGCLLGRGLTHSIVAALPILLVGALAGTVLGLWLGSRRRPPMLPGELLLLVGLVLLLGPPAYRPVLALGLTLYVARVVAVRVSALYLEPFLEGARALGAGEGHILGTHIWPHVRPLLPGVLATALGVTFLWMAELGMLGFYDGGGQVNILGQSLTAVATETIPRDPDLGQLISSQRWAWLDNPAFLIMPALLLALLNLALGDLGRALGRK